MADETITPEEQKMAEFWQGIDDRSTTIATALRCKVFPIVLQSKEVDGEFVIGFARVPDLTTQLRLIDKSADNGAGISLEAASQALESLIIASESDKRITDKEDASYWKGACLMLAQFMGISLPVLKKK